MSDLLSKASLVMIPSGYKEDVVYSPVPTDGSGDLSFTRASNGTRINSAGLVEDCPWNIAQQSETFNVSPWTNYGTGTITANATTAPNGTTTADLFVPNTTNYTHAVEQNIGTTSGAITMSVYAKAAGYNWLVLNTYVGGAKYTYFDLQNGVIGTTASGVTASIENVGNGWFKLICTLTGGASTYFSIISATANNTSSFAGNGTSGTYLWGAQLNIGSTAKPYFPTTDRLNVARLTYQNGGGGCPSLLLEKQSTNLLTYSEDFTNVAWSKGNSTITANSAISPDGTQNADTLVDDTSNAEHNISQTKTISTGVASTFSVYVKSGTQPFVMLRHYGAASEQYFCVVVNLNTGTITKTQAGTSTSATSSSITSVGNGWYRVTATCTFASTTAIPILQLVNSATPTIGSFGNYAYTGNGTNSVLVWGIQFEQSSYATSYIPTTSASATRVADACYKTGISSLIGQTEGTIFYDGFRGNESEELYVFMQKAGSTGINDSMYLVRDGVKIAANIYVSGIQVNISGGNYAINERIKIAFAYSSTSCALYVNGVQIGTDSSATIPTCANYQIGAYTNDTNSIYKVSKPINEALLFKTRLTNDELIALTTI